MPEHPQDDARAPNEGDSAPEPAEGGNDKPPPAEGSPGADAATRSGATEAPPEAGKGEE